MRNLKRALSLLLSSTMVLGMVVMGGSAAGYQDVDASNDNQEAIEVLQAVGIMSGVDDAGNFNPDGSLTRNEMAVVMAHLLNLDYDYYRGVNTFTDVPDWAAPYVAACVAEGVTAGIGNGLYGGDQQITAAQAGLMVMKALGYFQNQEDFGTDWQVATIRQASYINLFDKVNSDAETALTRGQVAQLVLNGLKAKMVTFTGDMGIQIGDVSVGYRAEYTPRANAAEKYNSIDDGTTNINADDQYYVQLGEELYNGDLKLKSDIDVFGRPARYWEYDGDEIGTYVKSELLRQEYTAKVTGKDLYELLGKSTIDEYETFIYVDGETEKDILGDAYFTEGNLVKTNTDAVGATGNGVLTQVYVDTQAKEITVSIINTYLAVADEDYDAKNDELDVTVYAIDNAGTSKAPAYVKLNTAGQTESLTLSGEDFDIADYVDEDIMLVNVANGEVQTIADPKVIGGTTIDAFKVNSWLEVEGTKYDHASTALWDEATLSYYTGNGTSTNLKDATYNVYLDPYGYVIGLEEIEPEDNYLFLTGIDSNASNLGVRTADATAIFLDGTIDSIKVNVKDSADEVVNRNNAGRTNAVNDSTTSYNAAIVNTWFTYTVDSDGVYTLKYVDRQSAEDATSNITIDSKHITRANNDASGYVVGNDDTVYINVETLDNVTLPDNAGTATIIDDVDSVTVGSKNVNLLVEDLGNGTASNNYNINNEIYTLYDSNNWIIGCVVIGEDQGASSNYAYVTSAAVKSERYDGNTDTWTWVREVVIDGELTDITYVSDNSIGIIEPGDGTGDADNEMDQGYWYKVSYYADGTVKEVEALRDYFDLSITYDTSAGNADNSDEFIAHTNEIEDTYDNADPDVAVLWMAGGLNTAYYTDPNYISFNEKGSVYTYVGDQTGFSVSPDVKVVVANAKLGDGTDDFDSVEDGYTGYNGLKKAIADLNNNFTGDVSAILENGIATSIIFNCTAADDGYDPGEETPDNDGVYSSEVDKDIAGAQALSFDKDHANARVDDTNALKLDAYYAGGSVKQQLLDALAYLGYTVNSTAYDSSTWTFEVTSKSGVKEQITCNTSSDLTNAYKMINVGGTDMYVLDTTAIDDLTANPDNTKAYLYAKVTAANNTVSYVAYNDSTNTNIAEGASVEFGGYIKVSMDSSSAIDVSGASTFGTTSDINSSTATITGSSVYIKPGETVDVVVTVIGDAAGTTTPGIDWYATATNGGTTVSPDSTGAVELIAAGGAIAATPGTAYTVKVTVSGTPNADTTLKITLADAT